MSIKAKHHEYDTPLFPDMAPVKEEVTPRSQEEVDAQIAAIAAAASRREVVMVNVASDAALDQGHPHETPKFGLPRPPVNEVLSASNESAQLSIPPLVGVVAEDDPDRFRLPDDTRAEGTARIAEIREGFKRPDRPKFPKI